MKRILTLICIFFIWHLTYSQDSKDLMMKYQTIKSTNDKVDLFFDHYSGSPDSIEENITSLNKIFNQFKERKDLTGMGVANMIIGYQYLFLEDYTNSLRYGIAGLQKFEEIKDSVGIMRSTYLLGISFQYSRNFDQALFYLKKSSSIAQTYANGIKYADRLNAIADCYIRLKKPDSALPYIKKAVKIGFDEKDTISFTYYISTFGEAYLTNKRYDLARPLLIQSLRYAEKYDRQDLLGNVSNDLSQLFYETGMFDSSIKYARQGIYYTTGQSTLMDAYEWVYKSFEKQNQNDSASKYFRLAVNIRDSLFSTEKNRTVQSLNFQQQLWEKERQLEIVQAKKNFKNRLTLYTIFGILFIILIIAALLYRNNQQQKKAKIKVEAAYTELKSTQAQLIQSEKMASLGELTAGIAHEIQNPLNFVNNFSEVNKELVDELQSELKAGKIDDAISISNDIKDNEEKINHHGKRADAIVKNMLQHSRSSSSKREPININILADEYLRLSYHGMRAKDKNFNAEIKTDFDETIDKINIVPQDIGRVLLNIYNNAFYAVAEKMKQQDETYQPAVSISTKKENNTVEIRINDNGSGIPQNIVDKIFQPFFTTKPTGQGTGLGLSLGYDIIKAHGGEIKLGSKEAEGSEFIIQLPV